MTNLYSDIVSAVQTAGRTSSLFPLGTGLSRDWELGGLWSPLAVVHLLQKTK